jgi:dCTP deaminase
MTLNFEQVKSAMRAKDIIISPKPAPKDFQPIVIDLGIHDKFWKIQQKDRVNVAQVLRDGGVSATGYKTKNFTLGPLERAVVYTHSRVTLSRGYYGIVEGRSSIARLGLQVHCSASLIQPGWNGRIALELFNTSPFPLVLTKGTRIASIRFHKIKKSKKKSVSRYQNAKG